jgi:hypothetical protein
MKETKIFESAGLGQKWFIFDNQYLVPDLL